MILVLAKHVMLHVHHTAKRKPHPRMRGAGSEGLAQQIPAPKSGRFSVVHVVAPGTFGGLEGVLQALAKGHAARGHDVHVVAVLDRRVDEYPLIADLREGGVNVLPLILPPRAYLRERSFVQDVCERIRPDVVHTHGYRPDVLHAGLARRLSTTAVTTVHGYTSGDWKHRLYQTLQSVTVRRFDAVVAVSRAIFNVLVRRRVSQERLYLVPNAWSGSVDYLDRAVARRELGIPSGIFHLGWVGRLSREKGADILIQALRHLGDVPCVVSLVGDGKERSFIEGLVMRFGLENRVIMHGMIPQAARYYRSFDVFVLSSRSEGTPLVLLETMDAGVPIIATEVGGVPDTVTRQEALLVPTEDPLALSRAIRTAYRDREDSAARARAARQKLRSRFALEPWLDRYEEIYRRATGYPDHAKS